MILVDPWGFPEKPSEQEPTNRSGKYKIIYPAVESYIKLFNPFTFMRAVGPYGKCSVELWRKLHHPLHSPIPAMVLHFALISTGKGWAILKITFCNYCR